MESRNRCQFEARLIQHLPARLHLFFSRPRHRSRPSSSLPSTPSTNFYYVYTVKDITISSIFERIRDKYFCSLSSQRQKCGRESVRVIFPKTDKPSRSDNSLTTERAEKGKYLPFRIKFVRIHCLCREKGARNRTERERSIPRRKGKERKMENKMEKENFLSYFSSIKQKCVFERWRRGSIGMSMGEGGRGEEGGESKVFRFGPLKTFTFRRNVCTETMKRKFNERSGRGWQGGRATPHRRSCLYNRFRGAWCFYIASKEDPFPLPRKYRKIFPFRTKTSLPEFNSIGLIVLHLSFISSSKLLTYVPLFSYVVCNAVKNDREDFVIATRRR